MWESLSYKSLSQGVPRPHWTQSPKHWLGESLSLGLALSPASWLPHICSCHPDPDLQFPLSPGDGGCFLFPLSSTILIFICWLHSFWYFYCL